MVLTLERKLDAVQRTTVASSSVKPSVCRAIPSKEDPLLGVELGSFPSETDIERDLRIGLELSWEDSGKVIAAVSAGAFSLAMTLGTLVDRDMRSYMRCRPSET